ncbi:hypothetical protein [Achromobacter insolitus]|uniref:hypothetical protein n=1 Tax=Achromobacter insolitus TaxID=217204 RepID=UPI0013E2A70C|nr:hypothetical protein [Achromobacter insolitus]NGT12866.1 hypothetical protein [Achromobacter insolitus]
MSFSISLNEKIVRRFDEPVLQGEIDLDGYKENFLAPVGFWSRADYLESWKKSLDHAIRDRGHAVLATSMRNPDICNFVFCWVVYMEKEQAYVQNRILFLDELTTPFVPSEINSYISERETVNEDGLEISEWRVDVSSVVSFFEALKKNNVSD